MLQRRDLLPHPWEPDPILNWVISILRTTAWIMGHVFETNVINDGVWRRCSSLYVHHKFLISNPDTQLVAQPRPYLFYNPSQ